MDKVQSSSTSERKRNALPERAVNKFKDEFYVKRNLYPKTEDIKAWASEFGLTEQQVRSWFATRRQREKPTNQAPKSVEYEDQEEEKAAMREFSHLKEDVVKRLLNAFRNRLPKPAELQQLASRTQLPHSVVVEFGKWKTARHKELWDNLATSPITPTTDQGKPIQILERTLQAHLDKQAPSMAENEHMMDFLPTPQASVDSPSSTRPQSLEPEVAYTSFYDVWKAKKAKAQSSQGVATSIPTYQILQSILPSSLTMFASQASNNSVSLH